MRLGKFLVCAGFVAGLSLVLSCSGPAQEGALVGADEAVPGVIGEGESYTLGKEDIVSIDVRNQPEFSGQFIVGPDGNVQYTFVGDIKAEGLNKKELADAITKALEKYVKVPEVSVAILAYRSKFVYILGEVKAPGKFPMKGDTVELRDAIIAAGLPTRDAALRRTLVITPSTEVPDLKKVDLVKILYKGILKDDLTLAPGDLVVVPSTVPSEINRAISNLLAPFTRAAMVADMLEDFGVVNP